MCVCVGLCGGVNVDWCDSLCPLTWKEIIETRGQNMKEKEIENGILEKRE